MCPIEARLAAAASGEDAAAIEHARECVACRTTIAAQREVIEAMSRLAPAPLRADRRAALAAEVMAHSDFEATPTWRGGRVMLVSTLLVAAGLALVMFAAGPRAGKAPDAPMVATSEELGVETSERAHLEAVPEPLRASLVASGADFARVQRGDADVVTLRDGEVSVDSMNRESVTIVAGDTRVTITGSRAKVVARRGVIVTTHVFAGTASVTTKGKSHVIDAGDVWMREAERAVAEPEAKTPKLDTSKPAQSLDAFRIGWEALRDRRHADAIEAFDRATDPVVAEDAAFWAAIAAERAGDLGAAASRLRTFLEKYPGSPRADAAKAALERVLK